MSLSALFKLRQPEPVEIRSEKKAEIVLNDGRFAQIFGLKIGHFVAAEDSNQMLQMAKLISLCVKIDDVPLTLPEVLNFSLSDFEKISEQLMKHK